MSSSKPWKRDLVMEETKQDLSGMMNKERGSRLDDDLLNFYRVE